MWAPGRGEGGQTVSNLGLAPRQATPALPSRSRDDVQPWQGCCQAARAWLLHSRATCQAEVDCVFARQPGQPVLDGQSRASPDSLKTSGRFAALAGSELLGGVAGLRPPVLRREPPPHGNHHDSTGQLASHDDAGPGWLVGRRRHGSRRSRPLGWRIEKVRACRV
jgi:hypothetical protein